MDPNEVLARLRAMAVEIMDRENLQASESEVEFADLFQALDEQITAGFLPMEWSTKP